MGERCAHGHWTLRSRILGAPRRSDIGEGARAGAWLNRAAGLVGGADRGSCWNELGGRGGVLNGGVPWSAQGSFEGGAIFPHLRA